MLTAFQNERFSPPGRIRGDEEMAYKFLQPVLITCVEAKVKNVNFDTKIVRQ